VLRDLRSGSAATCAGLIHPAGFIRRDSSGIPSGNDPAAIRQESRRG
jgi:hypothetical protein